jgi:hypothetical protein
MQNVAEEDELGQKLLDEQKRLGEQQLWAIDYVVEFLVGLVAQRRIAAAEAGLTDDPNGGVERLLADALSFVPSVADLRMWIEIGKRGGPITSPERVEVGKAERALRNLHSAVGGSGSELPTPDVIKSFTDTKAQSIWSAIPKAWRERREVAEYTGTETALAGMRALPIPIGDMEAHESWQRERQKLDQELGDLLEEKHLLEVQAFAVLLGERQLDEQQRDKYPRVKAAIAQKQAALLKLDGQLVFSNVTEVRRALSEPTAGELADAMRAQQEVEKLTQQLATTGGTAGKRRQKEKIKKLKERLVPLQPGPWKKFGSKAAVMKLAKRAGLTKDRKSPQPKPNS